MFKRIAAVVSVVGMFVSGAALAEDKKPMAKESAPAAAKAAPAPAAAPAAAAPAAAAPAGKEMTLTGNIGCAKCSFKSMDKCNTAIKVKEGGKEAVYYFDADSDAKHHEAYCKAAKQGTITGMVTEVEGKKMVAVTKMDAAKK